MWRLMSIPVANAGLMESVNLSGIRKRRDVPVSRVSVMDGSWPRCQFLAQTTYPYTSTKEGHKALLECLCQRMKGFEVYADPPPSTASDDSRYRPHLLEQPDQPIAPQLPPA